MALKFSARLGYHFEPMKAFRTLAILAAVMTFWFAAPHNAVQAQNADVPYWATLRWDTVNMRKGPSQDFPIDWVYKRKGLPVQVIRTRESWRLVVDPEGTQGWIERSQLSPKLGALIVGEDVAELREAPNVQAAILWRAEPGVVAELLRCRDSFCEIDVGGRSGWVRRIRIWGSGEM